MSNENAVNISNLRLAVARLEKDCIVLRRDHDKVDEKLTEAYTELAKSMSLISSDIRTVKRTVITFFMGAAVGAGIINWELIVKLIT